MKLWTEDNKRAAVQQIIDFLLPFVSANGVQLDWPVVPFSVAEISASTKGRVSRNDVYSVIKAMKNANALGIDDFELTFERLSDARQLQTNQQKLKWKFFLPMEMELAPDLPKGIRFSALSTQFFLISWQTVNRQVPIALTDLRELSAIVNLPTLKSMPPVFLSVSNEAPTWAEAWDELSPAFDVLRGLLEFTHGFGAWRHSTDMAPRRQVAHPAWLIWTSSDNGFDGTHFIVEEYRDRGRKLKLTTAGLKVLANNCKLLRKVPTEKSTISVVADALRLYSQAMDDRFPYGCFQGLWQMAEALTLAPGGKTQDVCKRLAWHAPKLKLKGTGFTELLEVFADKRNDLVHRGLHNKIDEEDINKFKLIVEVALLWLMRESANLPTIQHLADFYRFRTANKTQLVSAETVIKYINKTRKKT